METELQQLSWSIQQHSASMERSELSRLIEALKEEQRDLIVQLATAANPDVC